MDFGPKLNPQSGALWPADDYAADKALGLDFANSLSWRGKPAPTEELPDPQAWLAWSREHGVLADCAIEPLQARAAAAPDEAAAALVRATAFREALYNLLSANCQQEAAKAKDRMLVQDVLARAMARLRFARHDGAWSFELCTDPLDWDSPLYGPALSAAQLLTSEYGPRVGVCGRPECLWLFLDLTKNHSRKWCSMQTCGNVVKARSCYARKKATRRTP
ncbi:MAG: CGNR zinc finger domain-containing protein [Fimbriimonas ginsengisoli]|uniref:CGNR zinc finger domain-containing protein n=1 Tax=Fimbriimonas ginsengisoli TaxID=1005039 RepID=A0A931LSW5_FIMGI|nr:CGNR zinc finger domain-containing protein [Fimbriimonas ginsengisoli]